jgi:bacterioferritin
MKGSKKVIEKFQSLLNGELAARDQYLTHARMYEDWGLSKLAERISHEAEEEAQHADALIRRMHFLEANPELFNIDPLRIGQDVEGMLKLDLEVEYEVTAALKQAIAVCESEQDYQSREILEVLLKDTEEDHAYWLEQQLGLIKKVGLQNYLQSQM